jgi:hypothetical protein
MIDELEIASEISPIFKKIIQEKKWNFVDTHLPSKMSIKHFFEIFPNAIGLNIRFRYNYVDQDFIDQDFKFLLKDDICRLKYFDMTSCTRVEDDLFQYLKGIHTLIMKDCYQITDKAFQYLTGIHTLNMEYCNQESITDKAFQYLKGIHTLDMTGCRNITDLAFENLKGINTLHMFQCDQITTQAFKHIIGLKNLHSTRNIIASYLLNNTPFDEWKL